MIKATVDSNKIEANIEGTPMQIAIETCKLLHAIYSELDASDGSNVAREFYRKSLVRFLTNEDSPIFRPISEMAMKVELDEGATK